MKRLKRESTPTDPLDYDYINFVHYKVGRKSQIPGLRYAQSFREKEVAKQYIIEIEGLSDKVKSGEVSGTVGFRELQKTTGTILKRTIGYHENNMWMLHFRQGFPAGETRLQVERLEKAALADPNHPYKSISVTGV